MKKSEQAASRPAGGSRRPMTKEEALRQMVEQDPKKAAQLIKEILKGR